MEGNLRRKGANVVFGFFLADPSPQWTRTHEAGNSKYSLKLCQVMEREAHTSIPRRILRYPLPQESFGHKGTHSREGGNVFRWTLSPSGSTREVDHLLGFSADIGVKVCGGSIDNDDLLCRLVPCDLHIDRILLGMKHLKAFRLKKSLKDCLSSDATRSPSS